LQTVNPTAVDDGDRVPARGASEMRYGERVRRLWIATFLSVAACGSVNSAPPIDAADPSVDAAIDAADPPIDASDQPPATPPMLVGLAKIHGAKTATLTFPMTVPAGDNRFLIVTAGVGSGCVDPIPTVITATYADLPLTRLDAISGTHCGPNGARSEQWRLVAPPVGTNNVVIKLGDTGLTFHAGALAFTGVNQATPVRASAKGSGSGMDASVVVDSAVGDLVVATVGQGGVIVSPGNGQNTAFVDNASGGNTLDNTAASTALGAAPTVTMDWSFEGVDEWQMIVASLRAP